MKLSKDELKKFRRQEEKKQAILHDLGLLANTITYTFTYVCRTFYEARKEQERTGSKVW